ncbi:hypothetical protein [Streptomyces sp. TR06-5]|uniref:hypothetical protein n=1 Tax=unclassified Streptomyces TaxID=2593676 RepID=UPI0039A311A3
MRTRMTAVAAVAGALALLPAASAFAGSGPHPAPERRQAAGAAAAPSAAGNPQSARARAAGVCSDAYEIGSRGVIHRKGEKIGSVKQFYSPACDENYGYLWVWQSFHDTHSGYDVSIGVFSYDRGTVVGRRSWSGTNGQEFWSNGATTVSECTSALGTVRAAPDPIASNAWSTERC